MLKINFPQTASLRVMITQLVVDQLKTFKSKTYPHKYGVGFKNDGANVITLNNIISQNQNSKDSILMEHNFMRPIRQMAYNIIII